MATRGSRDAGAGSGTTGDLFGPAPVARAPTAPAPAARPGARPARRSEAPHRVEARPRPGPRTGLVTDGSPAAPRARHAWLALRLPELPLDVVAPGRDVPVVVLEGEGARRVVVVANAAALRRGVRPGQSTNAAHALVPELEAHARAPVAEERRLQALARWAVRYTPCVSLQPPDALLLEVRGSLRLFGGASALQARAVEALRALGHAVAPALAPTPLAALWLSRARPGAQLESPAALAGGLAPLPVACTGWPPPVREALERFGVHELGELRRLPRDGLARRLPPFVLAELDEAHGLSPVARRRHVAPERYAERLELPAEAESVARLEPGLDRLLERLGRFLRVRDAAVERLRVTFVHRGREPTHVVLGRGAPAADAAEWRLLLHARLERVTLPAPVVELRLRTDVLRPRPAPCATLPGLAGTEAAARGASELLDRLRARFGEAAVHGLGLVPAHRPEAAWRRVRAAVRAARAAPPARTARRREAATPPLPLAPRPLWLLATPERLPVREGQPWHHGFLKVEAGPERIESGWWDGGDVVRDYYVVVARSGARLWIYREPDGGGGVRWLLHGVFG